MNNAPLDHVATYIKALEDQIEREKKVAEYYKKGWEAASVEIDILNKCIVFLWPVFVTAMGFIEHRGHKHLTYLEEQCKRAQSKEVMDKIFEVTLQYNLREAKNGPNERV